MAKRKKKKSGLIDKKLKALFKGVPFEDGILTLSGELLFKLYKFIFDFKDLRRDEVDKEEIIRAIRRVWSQKDNLIRKEILNFISKAKSDIKDITKNREKIKKILSEIDATDDEKEKILISFEKLNSHKINREKIISKLNYIRDKKLISKLKEVCNFELNSINEIEFSHCFEIFICNQSLKKEIILKSKSLDFRELLTSSTFDEVVRYIKNVQKELIKNREIEINQFIKNHQNHKYLKKDEFCNCFQKYPVDSELYNTKIDFEIVQRVVKMVVPESQISELNEEFIIDKFEIKEFFGHKVEYKLSLSYSKSLIYSYIWQEKELPILDDLNSLNDTTTSNFVLTVSTLKRRMEELSIDLKVSEEFILDFIFKYIPQSRESKLRIREKTIRKILYHFQEYLKPLKEKKMREELLAKTIKDFKLLFPLARKLKRKIIFNMGATNSGKTFNAMEKLKSGETGYYLAPLRLLALEGFETLKSYGLNTSLITGEEEIIDEESTHISSTIEMLNFDVEVDVCVIDEIQMIADRDRGWAWVNGLIGAPAKEVILTGSENALSVVKELCEYLGEELEIVRFERKNPLNILKKPTSINQIEPNSAIITFSRREVLALRQRLSKKYSLSVIYGNLSPEVRREEAKRFRDGKSEILIATDAIAMGLNLPIKTVLFAKATKFDGLRRRELKPIEVVQIAGRAGRFGIYENGYVGALDKETLKIISQKLNKPIKQIEPPLFVMATLEHIVLIGEIIESDKLFDILIFFSENMEFEGPFVASNIESMVEVAQIVDNYQLELKDKYIFSSSPVTLSSPYLEKVFHKYLDRFSRNKKIKFQELKDLPPYAYTQEELLEKEDRVREVSLYLWLSFKYPDSFPDIELAIKTRDKLNRFIEESLKRGNFIKECRVCGKELDFSYKFNICEKCYRRKRISHKKR